jgi:hypothetical protein
MTQAEKIIRTKFKLLEVAKQLGHGPASNNRRLAARPFVLGAASTRRGDPIRTAGASAPQSRASLTHFLEAEEVDKQSAPVR